MFIDKFVKTYCFKFVPWWLLAILSSDKLEN